jgi:glutathione S-transferase
MRILHLALTSEWNTAVKAGSYRVSTRGLTVDEVGFIHCSTSDQVGRVAARFYADVTEPLTLLEMDDEAIRVAGTGVRYEDDGHGELFPHVYGAIDPAWVTRATPAAIVGGELVVG